MELYLVQHGLALGEDEDPTRPLSEVGRAEVAAVAHRAAEAGVGLGAIRHSGKLRAAQTAGILARHVRHDGPPDVLSGLGPKDDPVLLAARLVEMGPVLTLVGHLPHLARLTSRLLCGDAERELVAFRNGALVHLTRRDAGWVLAWVLPPELARR